MKAAQRRAPPLPLAQAFVVCREIIEDCLSHEFVLVRPFSDIRAAAFPLQFPLAVYVHLTGGHGAYELQLQLRDGEERPLWGWRAPRSIRLADPLAQQRVTLYDAVLGFPRPGRYFLVLLANGEELARHALQVLPIRRQVEQGPPA
jgi:hypothetical protein